MKALRLVAVAFLAGHVVLSSLAFAAQDASPADADLAALRKLQTQLASRKSADRVAAIERLRELPSAEMAKLVVSRGLKDRDADVRKAAETTLRAVKDHPEVCEVLAEALVKEGRRKTGADAFDPLFWIVLASSAPPAEGAVKRFLDSNAGASPEAVGELASRCDEIGKQAAPEDFMQLPRIAASSMAQGSFGLRRATIRAATHYKTKEAVGLLTHLLEQEKGELRGDIIPYLELASGEQFGTDAARWRSWWEEHEKTFQFPKSPRRAVARKDVPDKSSSYYGIPIYAKRLVFVLDASNSMKGDRIVAAKRELINAVNGLDADCSFALVTFNSGVNVWQQALAPANDQNKRAAEYWIDNQQLSAQTRSYDALEAAMRFDAEAIYFLTDGAPSGGQITEPTEIVTAISKLNRLRRESIYSIGVGLRRKGNKHEAFLDSLSSGNYAILRRVSE